MMLLDYDNFREKPKVYFLNFLILTGLDFFLIYFLFSGLESL